MEAGPSRPRTQDSEAGPSSSKGPSEAPADLVQADEPKTRKRKSRDIRKQKAEARRRTEREQGGASEKSSRLPSPKMGSGSEEDFELDGKILLDSESEQDVQRTAPSTPKSNLSSLSTLPFPSSFTPFKPTIFTSDQPLLPPKSLSFYTSAGPSSLPSQIGSSLAAPDRPSPLRQEHSPDAAENATEVAGMHLIDPDMDVSELAKSEEIGQLAADGQGVNDVSSAIIPETQRTPAAKVDGDDSVRTPRDGSPPARVHTQGGLLLPMNVEVEGDELATGEDGGQAVRVEAEDLNQVEILDDSETMPDRSVNRYFLELGADGLPINKNEAVTCKKCGQKGHIMRDCPHQVCVNCGEIDKHESYRCPEQMICFNCGERGHFSADCPRPKMWNSSCGICRGSHVTKNCKLLWRQYDYYTLEEREESLRQRQELLDTDGSGWMKHIFGAVYRDGGGCWCGACSEEGHWADDCPHAPPLRTPKLYQPSAFSKAVALSGPFSSNFRDDLLVPRGNHTRFSDGNLPTGLSGLAPAGNVGSLGRQKEKSRAQERARKAALEEGEEEEDDAFSRMASGQRGRQFPAHLPKKPKAPAIKFDNKSLGGPFDRKADRYANSPASSSSGRRGRDSEYDRGGSFRGDRHRDQRERSPDRGSRRSERSSRAEPTSSRRNKGGGRDDRKERDFEAEWRRSGGGGGNVRDWDYSSEDDRGARRGGGGGGRSNDTPSNGRSRGQRYHGGY